ncbi:hypothetical protein C8Q74DRAFT_898621 [Fomes fomentarius]|nr:hypothetical protein C8Q74DRAFT_898621 [Fomes fomentarius]
MAAHMTTRDSGHPVRLSPMRAAAHLGGSGSFSLLALTSFPTSFIFFAGSSWLRDCQVTVMARTDAAASVIAASVLLAFSLFWDSVAAGTTCAARQLDWYTDVVGENPCETYQRLRRLCNPSYQVPSIDSTPPGNVCDDPNSVCCCNTVAFQLTAKMTRWMDTQWAWTLLLAPMRSISMDVCPTRKTSFRPGSKHKPANLASVSTIYCTTAGMMALGSSKCSHDHDYPKEYSLIALLASGRRITLCFGTKRTTTLSPTVRTRSSPLNPR